VTTAATTATTTIAVEDRRGRVRAKVNYFACVQSAAFGNDVVTCIDMSRGGLGFRTKHAYAISTEVTIAVPFSMETPNAPAIYVPARVVNIAELPELKMFRCGVAFLPVAGTRVHS
jgi:c-di-GMP-binding flagellar brake protein YcgR